MTENIKTGKPDIKPDTPSHSKGTREGNQLKSYQKSPGHLGDDRSNARRSTGIGAKSHDSKVPGAPNISPP